MDKQHIIKQIKEKINGIEYGTKIDNSIIDIAKNNNIVIIRGASDDLIDFEGAIYNELDCYSDNIEEIYIIPHNGKYFAEYDTVEDLRFGSYDLTNLLQTFLKEKLEKSIKIQVAYCGVFNKDGWGFQVETPKGYKIDYDTFDILEDGALYCRGLILDLDIIKAVD